ncbi:MAG: hypothetical protein KC620_10260 [Myxococcales bacterium]|nr:hypothetical protein [Myxococcales bacterium]
MTLHEALSKHLCGSLLPRQLGADAADDAARFVDAMLTWKAAPGALPLEDVYRRLPDGAVVVEGGRPPPAPPAALLPLIIPVAAADAVPAPLVTPPRHDLNPPPSGPAVALAAEA